MLQMRKLINYAFILRRKKKNHPFIFQYLKLIVFCWKIARRQVLSVIPDECFIGWRCKKTSFLKNLGAKFS